MGNNLRDDDDDDLFNFSDDDATTKPVEQPTAKPDVSMEGATFNPEVAAAPPGGFDLNPGLGNFSKFDGEHTQYPFSGISSFNPYTTFGTKRGYGTSSTSNVFSIEHSPTNTNEEPPPKKARFLPKLKLKARSVSGTAHPINLKVKETKVIATKKDRPATSSIINPPFNATNHIDYVASGVAPFSMPAGPPSFAATPTQHGGASQSGPSTAEIMYTSKCSNCSLTNPPAGLDIPAHIWTGLTSIARKEQPNPTDVEIIDLVIFRIALKIRAHASTSTALQPQQTSSTKPSTVTPSIANLSSGNPTVDAAAAGFSFNPPKGAKLEAFKTAVKEVIAS